MLRIIVHECHNNKSDLFYCFVNFRKDFDRSFINNLWNRLEELKVPFESRVVVIISRTYFVALRILEKLLINCLEIACGIG